MANSRMKDYFDLWILANHAHFEGLILKQAIVATFQSRKSNFPFNTPQGLTVLFCK